MCVCLSTAYDMGDWVKSDIRDILLYNIGPSLFTFAQRAPPAPTAYTNELPDENDKGFDFAIGRLPPKNYLRFIFLWLRAQFVLIYHMAWVAISIFIFLLSFAHCSR